MSAFRQFELIGFVARTIIAVGVLIYKQIYTNSRNSYGYSYQERSEPPPSSRASSTLAQLQAPARNTREEIAGCPICLLPMSDATIQLPHCRHIFHDECFTIWRHAVVMMNPHAILCPTCSQV